MVNTLNARRPFTRRGVGSVGSFFAGSLTSELPLHTIAWQALATSALVQRGALRRPAGLAGFALATASWAMLARIHSQACRARDVFDTSLTEAFDRSGGELVDDEATDLDWRQIAGGPLIRWRRRYVATGDGDVSYGDAGRRNRLDVWRSPTLPRYAGAPVLVQVHGGNDPEGEDGRLAHQGADRLPERPTRVAPERRPLRETASGTSGSSAATSPEPPLLPPRSVSIETPRVRASTCASRRRSSPKHP